MKTVTHVWKFKRIVGHEGPFRPTDPEYKGSRYNVLVEWENGEITSEPLSIFGKDDPVTCAVYAREHGLLEEEGWKRFKAIAKREKKMLRMVNQSRIKATRNAPRYKFGYRIPRNYDEAMLVRPEERQHAMEGRYRPRNVSARGVRHLSGQGSQGLCIPSGRVQEDPHTSYL